MLDAVTLGQIAIAGGEWFGLKANTGHEYGGLNHRIVWRTFTNAVDPHEAEFSAMVQGLFRRMEAAILSKLPSEAKTFDPFNVSEWGRIFQREAGPLLERIVADMGRRAFQDVGGKRSAFNVHNPEVTRFILERQQRFASEVPQTTWDMLRESLAEGEKNGEGIGNLTDRVESIMGNRIASTPETIARTEVIGAANGGKLIAWQQSGAPLRKAWLAAINDPRTRETHIAAHKRYQADPIPLDADFEVGDGAGPMPGQIGLAEEDINCLPGDAMVMSLSPIQAATRREYSGDIVVVTTAAGRKFTATPNHPVLTRRGWRPLNLLCDGDDLVCYRVTENARFARPDPYRMPTQISNVFHLLNVSGNAQRIAGSRPQFHGDGRDGYVDIVLSDSQLGDGNLPLLSEPEAKQFFALANILAGDLSGDCPLLQLSELAFSAAHGGMSSSSKAGTFGNTGLRHAGEHRGASVAGSDSGFEQSGANPAASYAEQFRKPFLGFASGIAFDKVIDINFFPYVGHVYNLQTEDSMYLCNDIITHNCRCTAETVLA